MRPGPRERAQSEMQPHMPHQHPLGTCASAPPRHPALQHPPGTPPGPAPPGPGCPEAHSSSERWPPAAPPSPTLAMRPSQWPRPPKPSPAQTLPGTHEPPSPESARQAGQPVIVTPDNPGWEHTPGRHHGEARQRAREERGMLGALARPPACSSGLQLHGMLLSVAPRPATQGSLGALGGCG